MSGQVTGWVLRHGPKERAMRAVLITIADAANRDGEHSHPGISAMVEGSGYSRSTVFAVLGRLTEDGWVEVEEEGGGRGRATVFRVCTEGPKQSSPRTVSDEKQSSPRTVSGPKGSSPARETVQSSDSAPSYATVNLNGKAAAPPARPAVNGSSPSPLAETLLRDWYESRDPRPVVAHWPEARRTVGRFLAAGHDPVTLAAAMAEAPTISAGCLEVALSKSRVSPAQFPTGFQRSMSAINSILGEAGDEPVGGEGHPGGTRRQLPAPAPR